MEAIERGSVVLRKTPKERYEITAKVFEDTRGVYVLTIQKYNRVGGASENFYFSFVGNEITELMNVIKSAKELEFTTTRSFRVRDTDSHNPDPITALQDIRQMILDNPERAAAIASSELTTQDIVALGYRRKQLSIFERMLNDRSFFEAAVQAHHGKPENVWQSFFEKNHWIFGYGLSYLFLSGLDDRKLEQVVRGYDLTGHGKRADGVMKTQALISSLCFLEIKHADTPLLRSTPYRPGVWPPHNEVTGAVSQVQATVAAAMETLKTQTKLYDALGNPTGEEVHTIEPRSFLVVGSLGQLIEEHGPNIEKVRSFEQFRRNTAKPEIITFDELYHRAKFIVDTAAPV
ncbi:Shedu immune nuclease family protein [Pararhizobium sp. DWP1-1-3]|uniref:Shedu immune nuclease family protein n=1 Tax=Pararhizobium sp. DWP1-1-3 TaxID=2804652 RepID=UPI003CF4A69F